MVKTIGYARVSKREQAEDSNALAQQQDRLRRAGAEEVFTDVQSGRKDDRPKFQQVMALVRSRQVEKVVVTRIDRLGRSLPSAIKALNDFVESGVWLHILDGSVDLSTVGGRAQAGIMAVLAQMESEMISDRSRHGWEYLRQRQIAMNPPFGYKKVNDRHELNHDPLLCLIETKEELTYAQVARSMIDLFLEGQSLRQAIRRFNQRYGIQRFETSRTIRAGLEDKGVIQRSPSGLKAWLANPVLRGHLVYFGDDAKKTRIFYNTHPTHRLLRDQEFEEIAEIIANNKGRRGFGSVAPVYPLSGLVKCGVCGGTCYAQQSTRSNQSKPDAAYYYYYCKNANMGACTSKNYIRMDWIEERVIAALIEKAEAISEIAVTLPDTPPDPKLVQLQQQLAGLEMLGKNPAIDAAIADLKAQIQTLHYAGETIEISQKDLEEKLRIFTRPNYWNSLNQAEKRDIYKKLVKTIKVAPEAEQPLAKTENKLQARRRFVRWQIEIVLNL
jgi:site-specific DNA recombinase